MSESAPLIALGLSVDLLGGVLHAGRPPECECTQLSEARRLSLVSQSALVHEGQLPGRHFATVHFSPVSACAVQASASVHLVAHPHLCHLLQPVVGLLDVRCAAAPLPDRFSAPRR